MLYKLLLYKLLCPINFGFVNCHSIRNKGPLICDTIVSNNLDILALTETRIHICDTDSLLKSVTPPGFQLTHRPRTIGRGGGVGFLTKKNLPAKTVDAPTHSTFENIVISIVTHSKSFVVACVYRTLGSCSSAFLDDFLHFCGFLSSSVETLMSMWTQIGQQIGQQSKACVYYITQWQKFPLAKNTLSRVQYSCTYFVLFGVENCIH